MDPERNQPKKTEVRETKTPDGDTVQRTVTTDEAPQAAAPSKRTVAERVIYYIGGVIMALLTVRLLLALLGANRGNPFADFIFDTSAFFAQPFFGLFSYQPVYGASTLELSTLVAIIVYGVLTVGIAQLVGLTRR